MMEMQEPLGVIGLNEQGLTGFLEMLRKQIKMLNSYDDGACYKMIHVFLGFRGVIFAGHQEGTGDFGRQ